MEKVKKIIVSKSDEPTLVAEKLIDADAETVVLSIPKGSQLAGALAHLKLIKREATLLKKKVIVESVDEAILELCKKAGIDSVDPFFSKMGSRKKLSDIVVKPRVDETDSVAQAVPLKVAEPEETEPMTEVIKPATRSRKKFKFKFRFSFPRIFSKGTAIIAGVLLLVIAAGYVGLVVLPHAEVVVAMVKEPWNFSGPVGVDKAISAPDAPTARIPGQVFVQKTNATLQFVASGSKSIERKATGKITIYNALSSKPQSIVANTRFETADGKVFRITKGITIPGANIEDGKIVPSSIVADIIADQPGAAYNIGPIAKLTIPGFKGTPKFDTFYGEIKDPTTGGLVGVVKVATDADIKTAKESASKTIEASAQTLIATQIPAQFKTLAGASKFVITKQTVNSEADASGKFSIFTEGQITTLAFQERDLLAMLSAKIKTEKGSDYQFENLGLTYGAVKADDPASGKMSVTIEYQAQASRIIDQTSLVEKLKGHTRAELEPIKGSLQGIQGLTVSLKPFWVRSIPSDSAKIKLIVE